MKKTFRRVTSIFLAFVLLISNAFMTLAAENAGSETNEDWYIAGTANLCGTAWAPGAAENKMTYNPDTGLYEITLTGIEACDSFAFKVTKTSWQEENYGTADGGDVTGSLTTRSDVTITFKADTHEIEWTSVSAVEPEETETTYVVAGLAALCGSEWNTMDTSNLMSYNDSAKRYEKIYTGVAAGTYEFKIVKNGSIWMPEDANKEVTVEKDNTNVIVWYDEATGEIGTELSNNLVIKFCYNRPDKAYEGWSLWIWDDDGAGKNTAFTTEEDGKKVLTYFVQPNVSQVGFIVRDANWNKDIGDDRFIDVSQCVGGVLVVNIESGESEVETVTTNVVTGAKILLAVSDGDKSVTVTSSAAVENYENAFAAKCEGNEIEILSVTEGTKDNTYVLTFAETVDLEKAYTIEFGGNTYKITLPSIYKSESFIGNYTYEGNDLGATWSKESTTFKVWAPTASDVTLNLYESGAAGTNDLSNTFQMTKGEKGVWETTVAGDLNGTYYTYSVTNENGISEACDPYANAVGVNGDRAMVIDLDTTDPEGWEKDTNPNADLDMTDIVLYELHVRDASIDESSGVSEKNRGKFLGLTETGTTTEGGTPTVLDHMVDLGITHLHLLPVADFSSNSVDETKDGFNWGYDPKNYNVPEGSYSSDPYHGEVRVAEMKEMVQTLHENDISVVMDVVYNHVSDAESFCFNQIVPDYFTRKLENGGYSNDSACGNDVATEHVMVRKYIVDSINYWAEEYHIDGFRFDLVGLLDVDTINEIMETVWKTHPDVIFYGEGWSMNSYDTGVEMTTQTNAALVNGQANNNNNKGFAFFNDTFRNTIKGSVFDLKPGYVSGATGLGETIEESFRGLAGDWCTTPTQTINYNSCHDNYTLYDRILLSRTDASKEDIVKMNNLAAAINFTSQGVPFVQAGEEFLRSKPDDNSESGYNENSYNAGDAVNSIKWNTLDEKTQTDVYKYYKGLIAFRKAHAALRMTTAEEVNKYITAVDGLDANVTAFEISREATDEVSDGLFIIFNPNEKTTTVTLPEGKWNVCVNGEKAGTEVLATVSGKVTVDAISAMVLVKADADTADMSSTDTPSTDTPSRDISSVDTPSADVPSTDTPSADITSMDTPSTDVPGTDTPSADIPSTPVAPDDGKDSGASEYSLTDMNNTSVTMTATNTDTTNTNNAARTTITAEGNADVSISAGSEIIPGGSKFTVTAIESGDVFHRVSTAVKKEFGDKANFKVFDMTLTNAQGAEIHQLNDKVAVTMPVPTGLAADKLVVYRLEDDDKLVKCDSTVKDGKVTFTTDHFSTYIFAEQTTSETVEAPKTGDTEPITLAVLLTLVAVTGLAYYTRKKVAYR